MDWSMPSLEKAINAQGFERSNEGLYKAMLLR
jgi:hypothetical protein